MTHCPPILVAAAVAESLSDAAIAGQLSAQFQAVFSFGSEIIKLEDINATDGLIVDVLPHQSPAWSMRSRETRSHSVKVKVGIRRRIDTEDRDDNGAIKPDEIAAYCDLLYEILNLFAAGRKLPDVPDAVWNPAAPIEIRLYDEDALKQGLYVGWVHLPFIVHEEA